MASFYNDDRQNPATYQADMSNQPVPSIDPQGNLMLTYPQSRKYNAGRVRGSLIIPGLTDPDNSRGQNGDYWLKLTTVQLYGPKSNGVWPTDSVELLGSTGMGVKSAVVDSNGHLQITFTDDSVHDAGYVMGQQGQVGNIGAPGKDGEKGQTGSVGAPGSPGRGITGTQINNAGHLIISYSDSTTADVGYVIGGTGAPGSKGDPGTAGRGITTVQINTGGRLIITYSDGTTVDAGNTIGQPGQQGTPGTTPAFTVGNVQTGSPAAASLTGTASNPILNLTIPAGEKGQTGNTGAMGQPGTSPTISVGTVTTLPAGQSATATLTGTYPAYVLNLGLPQAVNAIRTKRQAIPNIFGLAVYALDIAWPTAFADTNYTITGANIVTATGTLGLLGVLQIQGVRNITASGCTVDIKNVNATVFNTANVFLHISAIHD